MASIEYYEMTPVSMQEMCNQSKELLVEALVRDGFLLKEDGDKINNNYAIVVHKKTWLGRIFKMLGGLEDTDDKALKLRVMKAV